MGADLVEHDTPRVAVLDLITYKPNFHFPDRLRRLSKITVELIDRNLDNQCRRQAAPGLRDPPEDAACPHRSADGFP